MILLQPILFHLLDVRTLRSCVAKRERLGATHRKLRVGISCQFVRLLAKSDFYWASKALSAVSPWQMRKSVYFTPGLITESPQMDAMAVKGSHVRDEIPHERIQKWANDGVLLIERVESVLYHCLPCSDTDEIDGTRTPESTCLCMLLPPAFPSFHATRLLWPANTDTVMAPSETPTPNLRLA